MYEFCRVQGPHVLVRPFTFADSEELAQVQQFNRHVFAPVMPLRDDSYFTKTAQAAQIDLDLRQWQRDRGYAFAVLHESRLVGRVALKNVVRGAWQNATLGYWIDSRCQGRGLATEAVLGALMAAFEHFNLHRVQAAIMPRNLPSLAVIAKAAFYCEGEAPRYLCINGTWEDHRIFSMTREAYRSPEGFFLQLG